MADEPKDNVVSLKQPQRDEEKLLNIVVTNRKEYAQKRCKHGAVIVEEAERVLRCTQCGIVLDPFEHILSVAYAGEAVVTEITKLYQRRDELRESVANLEREEKNVKARLRSARTAIAFAENDLKNVEDRITQ
ncbi:hypothetical protein NEJ09_002473 [Salmonella enterica]|nr:hypothetical protein [Salmonella enterica]HCM1854125.1 hypothetical protein [Salmonella enterica subsp. arizonae serovar 56:z4,z23:-]EDI9914565.1 hypothetical protein [Salmonella enterica]EGA9871969.1 hypothetical protein [Salmonella enterica]EGL5540471.1 hypothetical protein [Salmonella enterica]